MMRDQFRLGWAFVLVGMMLFAIALQAQPPQGGPPEYRAKQILGTAVHIQGNIGIGKVEDIVFGDDGLVEYLVVLNEGKLISVPWEAAKFNFEKRIATVNITRDQYQAIPTFTVETYPRFFTPEFQVQTYKYYGLTPAQERRIERRFKR
jgi:hypothetical protein